MKLASWPRSAYEVDLKPVSESRRGKLCTVAGKQFATGQQGAEVASLRVGHDRTRVTVSIQSLRDELVETKLHWASTPTSI